MTSFFLLQGRQNVLCHLAVAEAYFYTGSHWRLQRGAVVVGALRVGPRGASPHPCCLWGHTKAALPQSFGENVSLGELARSSFIPEFFWFSFLVPFIPGHREEPRWVGWKCLQGFLPFYSSIL